MVAFADVDIRAELGTRPSRVPDYHAEQRGLAALASELADNPRNMLQKLVEVAAELCGAHTAGISLLEGAVFRWEAVAGVHKQARGGTMPRDASPCGVCIDRGQTELMYLPDRIFPAACAEPRFVEVLLIPFQARGKAIGTVWIISHTPDRKFDREDERIVRALSHFASAGWQLWTASEAAALKSRRKDDFLALLGHELRNPLAAIAMAVPLVNQRLGADQVGKRRLEVIDRQARHIGRLAEDLLDTARIGSGKLQLKKKAVDLRTIVADAIEMTRGQVEGRRQTLAFDQGLAPAIVEADQGRLVQVMANLIDNAAKYSPDDGHITITISTVPGEVLLEVCDTGLGLRPEQLESIFEPFVQVEEPGASSAGGLGLGLALARSLTELHGGTVRASSGGPGQGSCLTIRLPAHTAA